MATLIPQRIAAAVELLAVHSQAITCLKSAVATAPPPAWSASAWVRGNWSPLTGLKNRLTWRAQEIAPIWNIVLTHDLPPVDRASQVTVPVQVIVGEKSPAGIQDVASQLTQAIPGATFIPLAGQDYMVSAKALLPVLAGFLKS